MLLQYCRKIDGAIKVGEQRLRWLFVCIVLAPRGRRCSVAHWCGWLKLYLCKPPNMSSCMRHACMLRNTGRELLGAPRR